MRKSGFVWVSRLKYDERNHLVLFVVAHLNHHSDMQAVLSYHKAMEKEENLMKKKTFSIKEKQDLLITNEVS